MRTPLLLLVSVVVGCGAPYTSQLDVPATDSVSNGGPPSAEAADAGGVSAVPPPASGSDDGGSGATVDSNAVLSAIAGGAYMTSSAFVEVTRDPYASAVATGSMIREWVTASSASDYELIAPSVTGSNATVAPGTTIVRAVLDTSGTVQELTLMHKGPAGYNPALGDWWFGVTDPQGNPEMTDAGAQLGKLDGCYSCHIPRSNDGYLFGVPLDDRASDDAGTSAPDAGSTSEPDAGADAGTADAGHDSGSSGHWGGGGGGGGGWH